MALSDGNFSARQKRLMIIIIIILSVACLIFLITTIVFAGRVKSQETAPPAEIASVHDLEEYARKTMSSDAWNFVNDGATNKKTQAENLEAFSKYKLMPKILVNVSDVITGVWANGHLVDLPVGFYGSPYMKWMCEDADYQAMRATGNLRSLMIVSDESSSDTEYMAKRRSGNVWQQIHLYKSRSVTKSFVDRIIRVKEEIKAIVVSVDRPVLGISYNQKSGKINFPSDVPHLANFPRNKMEDLVNPAQTWSELSWLRSYTSLPIIVKGILRPEDAKKAIDLGANGVIVSNEGGRLLDGVPAAIDALPGVVAAVNPTRKIHVYMEGGVRSGTDALKALALGAKMVFVRRPMMWALHHSCYEGVEKLLKIYKDELVNAMQLIGARTIEELTPDMILK